MHATLRWVGHLTWTVALALLAAPLPAGEFYVGQLNHGCEYPDLASAVAAAAANGNTDPDTILHEVGWTEEIAGPVVIDLDATGSLSIGGHRDCQGWGHQGSSSNLRFSSGRGLVVLGGASTGHYFQLFAMDLAPSAGSSGVGRMLDLSGRVNAYVSVTKLSGGVEKEGAVVRISGADASIEWLTAPWTGSELSGGWAAGDGGGILIDGAYADLLSFSITNNHAEGRGGGVACRGGGTAWLPRLEGNSAVLGGGGLAADDCTVEYVRAANNSADPQAGDGGGIHASGGASVRVWISDPYRGLWGLSQNSAHRGGGLFATGVGTTVSIENVGVVDNAAEEGGGMVVENGAQVTVARSRIGKNSASLGSAASVAGPGSSLLFESSLLGGNSGGPLIAVDGGAEATVALSTAVANDLAAGPAIAVAGTGSRIELFSSVMADGQVLGPPASGTTRVADCVVALDLAGFPVEPRSGSYLQVGSAGEVLLRTDGWTPALRFDSPAIDFFDELSYQPTGPDYDGEVRPWDQPPPGSSRLGILDLGADESYDNSGFFGSGFETGDCSEWSLAVSCS